MDKELIAVQRELSRIKREARGLWSTARRNAKLHQYTDISALRSLDRAIERAYPAIDPRDLRTALEVHGADVKSGSPWYAAEWIAQARISREASAFSTLSFEDQERAIRAAR